MAKKIKKVKTKKKGALDPKKTKPVKNKKGNAKGGETC